MINQSDQKISTTKPKPERFDLLKSTRLFRNNQSKKPTNTFQKEIPPPIKNQVSNRFSKIRASKAKSKQSILYLFKHKV